MEIERKFLITNPPENLESYPHAPIKQAYLNTDPVLRIRQHGDRYIFTYKGKGLMCREEYNMPLNEESFLHLLPKADGNVIEKVRYKIPLEGTDLVIELDLFSSPRTFMMAEVEFPSEDAALAFIPPSWFGKEVTHDKAYHNSNMI